MFSDINTTMTYAQYLAPIVEFIMDQIKENESSIRKQFSTTPTAYFVLTTDSKCHLTKIRHQYLRDEHCQYDDFTETGPDTRDERKWRRWRTDLFNAVDRCDTLTGMLVYVTLDAYGKEIMDITLQRHIGNGTSPNFTAKYV